MPYENPKLGYWGGPQTGTFFLCSSYKGTAFLDREIYLPGRYVEDHGKRTATQVPNEVEFFSFEKLYEHMLKRAVAAGVPHNSVVGHPRANTWRPVRIGNLQFSFDLSWVYEDNVKFSGPPNELLNACSAAFIEAVGLGLGNCKVRSWTGWHRHITLCFFAHAIQVVARARANGS